jgi:hypothetical protein
MAQAPPLTALPFQAGSGSYRMRLLYASARYPKGAAAVLIQLEHGTSPLHRWPGGQLTCGPASQAKHCQGWVDIKTATTAGRERREYAAFVRRVLHACSRRVGDGAVEALALMLGLAEEIDALLPRR